MMPVEIGPYKRITRVCTRCERRQLTFFNLMNPFMFASPFGGQIWIDHIK